VDTPGHTRHIEITEKRGIDFGDPQHWEAVPMNSFLTTAVFALTIAVPVGQASPGEESVIDEAMETLQAVEAAIGELEADGLSGSATVDFTGDEASEKSRYTLDATAEVAKGEYPSQFRFNLSSAVSVEDGTLEQDLTSLVFNYDYYFTRYLEVYGFSERFSDNYLSINQRYEVGFGTKLEWNSSGIGKKYDTLSAIALTLGKMEARLESLVSNSQGSAEAESALRAVRRTRDRVETLRQIERLRTRVVSVGLAFSVFAELERGELATYIDTVAVDGEGEPRLAGSETTLASEEEQRLRWVVRPSVTYRPVRGLSLKGHVYFKLPLGRPWDHPVRGGLDYRIDSRVEAKLDLATSKTGLKEVSLVTTFEANYDNTPPVFDLPDGDEAYGLILRTDAKQLHTTYKMALRISI
jgi:hypothetical protein